MTTNNYSITGLKDLLNDLENLSTCLMGIPKHQVDSSVILQLQQDQFNLIQTVNSYASMLRHSENSELENVA
tara:strand:- start:297 stop:512 length:216 start_codon:yes stop_codon:yes gene_type:complete